MKPVLNCFVFCDQVCSEHGKFSMLGVFYRIHVMTYPSMHNCYLVVGWYGEKGQHCLRIRFFDPDGMTMILEVPGHSFVLSPDRPYFNAIVRAFLPLEREGVHWVEVLLDDSSCGRFPLHVVTVSAYPSQ